MKDKSLVVLSGGQDSTTCFFLAYKEYKEVECVFFDYGQRHKVEKEAAMALCDKYDVPLHIVELPFMTQVSVSALLDDKMDVNQMNEKNLPNSFVPNRNQMFYTIAHSLAQKIGAETIYLGVCQTDYSGYPDCRNEFVQELSRITNIGSDAQIRVITPLMWLTKAETFKLAEEFGGLADVLELSHTCYEGDHETENEWGYGCGQCPACNLRENGWREYKAKYRG